MTGIRGWGRTKLGTKVGAKDTMLCLKVQRTKADSEQEIKPRF